MPVVLERVESPSVDTTSAHKPHRFSYTSAMSCLLAPQLSIPLWPDIAGIIVLVCNKCFIRVFYYWEHKYPGKKDGSVDEYSLGTYLSFKTQLCQSNLRQGTKYPAHQFPASKMMITAFTCSAEGPSESCKVCDDFAASRKLLTEGTVYYLLIFIANAEHF